MAIKGTPVSDIPLGTAIRVWARIGLLGFGGPAGQIALMHREVVVRRDWVSEADFQHALSFCVLLPGPEAQQLATYLGWRLHGRRGGVLAGTLFWLPGALLLWSLGWLYVIHGNHPAALGIVRGLRAAVVALVVTALWRMSAKTLRQPGPCCVALAAFAAALLGAWFPILVLTAGLLGWWNPRITGDTTSCRERMTDHEAAPNKPKLNRSWRTAVTWLAIWWLPLLGLGGLLGWDHVTFQLGTFFSRAAMVTLGGAYAVLPYVAEHAESAHWVSRGEFLDGLALGETTPGPLVLVLQWVGFLAGWKQPGGLSPLAGATLGAAVTCWATFAPSFLWIFTLAPWIERLRNSRPLTGALRGVSAAVIGVLATLALQLIDHAFLPRGHSGGLDQGAVLIGAAALAALAWRRWPAGGVVLACGLLGWMLGS